MRVTVVPYELNKFLVFKKNFSFKTYYIVELFLVEIPGFSYLRSGSEIV